MDTPLILIAAAAVALAGVALWLVLRARAAPAAETAGLAEEIVRLADIVRARQADLDGRLRQLAENQSAAQGTLTERLHAQERHLNDVLEKRFSAINERLHSGLNDSSTRTLETMGKIEARLAVIDEAQKNIRDLGGQIVGLQDILGNKQSRGAFGEARLETMISDMLPPDSYAFQKTLSNGKRVDCLIELANPPGPVAIDAKFPLSLYEQMRTATDEAPRATAARAFKAALAQHIKDIASKYLLPGETADWALMFVPSESLYSDIHAHFPDLVEESQRAHVLIVGPTTLWAQLLGVRALLRDARMHEQAALIRNEVAVMLKDVARLAERVETLRRHFAQAENDIREIEISARKVTSRGEKIEAVEVAPEATAHQARLVGTGD